MCDHIQILNLVFRWLHGACDLIKTEIDAEKCAEEGYNCILCRPRDVPPPHLIPSPIAPKPPTPTKSPEVNRNAHYFVDGVYLSDIGNSLIKSLALDHGPKKKRKKPPTVQDKEAGIMATIESVVAGSSTGKFVPFILYSRVSYSITISIAYLLKSNIDDTNATYIVG